MKLDGLTHPKTKELALTLGIPLPHAVGLLDFLWAFVGQQTPEGNIGKWSNGVIAQESQWTGDADDFVSALISCRFLDKDDDHRLLVHDWSEHAPNWVHAKLKKKGRSIIRADLSPDISPDISGTQEGATSLGKARQGKREKTAPRKRGCRIPENFPTDDDLTWASENHPAVNRKLEAEKFRDYWSGVSGQKGVKLDWPATWRNWIRRTAENQPKNAEQPDGPLGQVLS